MNKLKLKKAKSPTSRVKVFSSRLNKLSPDKKRLIIFVVGFAAIGTLLLIISFAATPTQHVEPENSTLTGCVSEVSDSNASGGGAVQFGTGCSGAPNPPADIANGQGAYKLISWGGGADPMDEALWQSRGFGGSKRSTNFLFGFGGGQQFRGSSASSETAGSWSLQKSLEAIKLGKTPGFEGYIGAKVRDTSNSGNAPVVNWWSDADRAEFSDRWGDMAAFAQFQGLEGTSADTEQGYWGLDYAGNTHTDQENIARIESWGYMLGQKTFKAQPDSKILVYDWYWLGVSKSVIRPSMDDTFANMWYGDEAARPKHTFWLGYMKAMADHVIANPSASPRMIRLNADFYKPKPENYYKYDTQSTIAELSQESFTQAQWNAVSDKIDSTPFTWFGTDMQLQAPASGSVNRDTNVFTIANHGLTTGEKGSTSSNRRYAIVQNASAFGLEKDRDYWVGVIDANTFYLSRNRDAPLSGAADITASGPVTIEAFKVHTSYYHTPEPDGATQQMLARRYGMGTRRGFYDHGGDGTPDGYTFFDYWHRDGSFNPANNWYLIDPANHPTYGNVPGGHIPGLQAAASSAPVSTTPPTITADSVVKNSNGTYTIKGEAFHIDGIRSVRGYVHPNSSARVAARLVWDLHGGSVSGSLANATQDYTLTITGSPGQYVMLTAVSIHDQTHSIRVKL